MMEKIKKDVQYYKFCMYGFIKNLQFFDPYLLLFFIESGISYFQIGILFGVREICTNVLEIPTGVVADSFGRRKAMMAAFGAYILSFLVFYFYPGFGMYIFAMVLFAFGEAFRSGTHKAMILDYLKRNKLEDQKVHYYGHTRSWSQRGSALSALIAAALVFSFQAYRTVFLFTAIPYVFGFFLIRSYPRYLDFSVDRNNPEERSPSETEAGLYRRIKMKTVFAVNRTLEEFRGLLQSRKLRYLFLNSSIYDGVFKTSKDYIQPVMKSLALSLPVLMALTDQRRIAVVVGFLYFVLYVFTSIVSQYSGLVAEKFKSQMTGLNTVYLLSIGVLLAVGLSMRYNAFLPGVIIFIGFYILQNVRRPMTLGYISENIKGSVMATGLSIESQLKTLVVTVLAPLFGALADTVGLEWAFCVIALLLLSVYPKLRVR